MNSKICFNKIYFIIFIVIGIFFLIYLDFYLKNNNNLNDFKSINKMDSNKYKTLSLNNSVPEHTHDNIDKQITHSHPIDYNNINQAINKRDLNSLQSPMHPPIRRPPRNIFPTIYTEYPTRGFPDTYQYLGNLKSKTTEKVVKLFGRQEFPGSYKYEYYGLTSSDGIEVKINIEKNNEIYDGDEIKLKFYGNEIFTVFLNKDDYFKYSPYY